MSARHKVGLSLLSIVLGWAVGGAGFFLYARVFWGGFADVALVVVWTLPFVIMGWLVFFLPLVLVVNDGSGLIRFPAFALVGSVVALVAFFLLVGWWLPLWRESVAYLIHPALTGAVAGAVYSLRSS
jgi:hypothetical protein